MNDSFSLVVELNSSSYAHRRREIQDKEKLLNLKNHLFGR